MSPFCLHGVDRSQLTCPDCEYAAGADKRRAAQLAQKEREQEERARSQALKQEARDLQDALRREAEQQRLVLLSEYRAQLELDFVAAPLPSDINPAEGLSTGDYWDERARFVQRWSAQRAASLGGDQSRPPDIAQATAIGALGRNIQLIARAGSGKTSTTVDRAVFLQEQCGVLPSEILLLAFNRRAAAEIEKRLEARVEGDIPYVMTFHALAYALVQPQETLLVNGSNGDEQMQNRVLQETIDDFLSDERWLTEIRTIMLAYFRSDWSAIIEGGYLKGKSEFLRIQRSLPRLSMRGEAVKSWGEKVIADSLFEHEVPYLYEATRMWSGRNYRPDFMIPISKNSGVIIEYFGMAGDPEYDVMSSEKRRYWAEQDDWQLLELSPQDVAAVSREAFSDRLMHDLRERGVDSRNLSDDEIIAQLNNRPIDRFTEAVGSFVRKCRKTSLSEIELRQRIASYTPAFDQEGEFLSVAVAVYAAYLDRLKQAGEEDFDGLMIRAAQQVTDGGTIFRRKSGDGDIKAIRHLCIDEYQDFSEQFFNLLSAMRSQAPNMEVFCVGDDWQAINGFAGSDLKYFNEFDRLLAPSEQLQLSTNYRSKRSIVEAGNLLMSGRGAPARVLPTKSEGRIAIGLMDSFEPLPVEVQRHGPDVLTPAVLRLVVDFATKGQKVTLLSRTGRIAWPIWSPVDSKKRYPSLDGYVRFLSKHLSETQQSFLSCSTAHGFKGLESEAVIVLDALARRFPLIHPTWAFTRVLGDSIEKIVDEERRLMYVAMTRAEQDLVILTSDMDPSPFLGSIMNSPSVGRVKWSSLSPPEGAVATTVVCVGPQSGAGREATIAIKEFLKAHGFRWAPTAEVWKKEFPVASFDIEKLKLETWSLEARGIRVEIKDDHDRCLAVYQLELGQWGEVNEASQMRSGSP